MSGGSLNYLYSSVEDAGNTLAMKGNTPLQRAFGQHLIKVAKALHDVEWVWSHDYGIGDDDAAIREALGENTKALEMDVLIQDAKELIEQLTKYTE